MNAQSTIYHLTYFKIYSRTGNGHRLIEGKAEFFADKFHSFPQSIFHSLAQVGVESDGNEVGGCFGSYLFEGFAFVDNEFAYQRK